MKRIGIVAAFSLAMASVPISGAAAAACDTAVNNTYKKLSGCASLSGARGHQAALQAIADANNGIRTSGTPGYDASAEYAAGVLRRAGYDVTVQEFQFQTFISNTPSVLEQVSRTRGRDHQQHHVLLGVG